MSSLLPKTSDCVERVALCRGVLHAAALLTLQQPDLDLPQHSESLESHQSRLD